MKSGIYWILNKVNNKTYIGCTTNFYNRWSRHRLDLNNNRKSNMHLQNAWNLYGAESFDFEILQCCNKEELLKWEEWWITLLGSRNRYKGYNILESDPHTLIHRHNQETKEKLSILARGRTPWNKGKKCPTLSSSLLGKSHTLEHREKTSKAQSKTWQITTPEGEITVVTNLKKFCVSNNLQSSSMQRVAN